MDNLAVSMQGITKIFNGVKANDNVDFNLRKGSIHGLLGENGAGKTTLMNILYGLYQQEAGDIYINGSKEEISSPIKAISLGIGMVHQHFMLARPMTVVENVMLGKKSRRGILLDTKETATELKELADKYKMNIDPYSKIWQLSVGEHPRAADSKGISVAGVRYAAVLIGGLYAGAAGAFMSIAYMNLFTESIVSGRGFIAVSVVIFARFMPVRAMWGALLFGFASALQMRLQALGIDMANQLMLMLPYIMTIAALIFASKKAEFPSAYTIPYSRLER